MNQKEEKIRFVYEFSKNSTYIEMYKRNFNNQYEYFGAFKKTNIGYLNKGEMFFYFYIHDMLNKTDISKNSFEFLEKRGFIFNRIPRN